MPHEIRSHRRPRMRRWGPGEAAFVAGLVLVALSGLSVVLDHYGGWRYGDRVAALPWALGLAALAWALGHWHGRDYIDT